MVRTTERSDISRKQSASLPSANWSGDYEAATADLTTAILLDPTCFHSHHNRAIAWHRLGNYAAVKQDHESAIRLEPGTADAYNGLAWLFATCPNAEFRNGPQAIELATKACELSDWKVANNIGTLAAAYAEIAEWENAVKRQKQAIELATDGQNQQAERIRLELYLSQKPFREPVHTPPAVP